MIQKVLSILLLSGVFGGSTRYDENAKIEDVRGGVELTVTYPPTLVSLLDSSGQIKAKLGNFGHIQYGTAMHVEFFYPQANPSGCTSFLKSFKQNSIVMVDAGGCPVTTKVRNIE